MKVPRHPAQEVLEIDGDHLRKTAPVALDLNGIAKGCGVDRLAETLRDHGIAAALVGIDGEMRASGLRSDGASWPIALKAPDPERRTPHAISRCRMPPWRRLATTAVGSKFRDDACRTPWIQVAARH